MIPTCGTCLYADANRPGFLECRIWPRVSKGGQLWNKADADCATTPILWRPIVVKEIAA